MKTEYITQEQAEAFAHRRATKYVHRTAPGYASYGFVPHTLMDFVRNIEAAAIQAYRDSLVAGVVLPEPQAWKYTSKYCGDKLFFTSCESELITSKTENATPLYTADQLRQAVADALAKQVTRAPMFEFRECEDSQAAAPDPKESK